MHYSRLLYTSRACPRPDADLTDCDRDAIAAQARQRNSVSGITGCLVLVDGTYLQILEGAPEQVEETFERICKDMRHADVRLIDLVGTGERLFEGWDMACLDGSAADCGEGMADELRHVRNLAGVNASQAVAFMRELVTKA